MREGSSPMAYPIVRRIGYTHTGRVVGYHLLYLGEQAVGLVEGSVERCLVAFHLSQVGYHDGGVEVSLGHLVQVYEDAWVSLVETDVLVKFHGCVAMRVERERLAVPLAGPGKRVGFAHEPFEERHHGAVSTQYHAFGMPLHAKH